MNEMDLKTRIEGLEKAIAEHKDFAGNYESDLVDMIVTKVCNLFKEADCPEDDDSQLNTQTVAEKII